MDIMDQNDLRVILQSLPEHHQKSLFTRKRKIDWDLADRIDTVRLIKRGVSEDAFVQIAGGFKDIALHKNYEITEDFQCPKLRALYREGQRSLQEGQQAMTNGFLPYSDLPEFPVEFLSGDTCSLVKNGAFVMGCPPEFLALPMLTILGAAIGNSRRLEIYENSWYEKPNLYTAIIAESGKFKTPALKLVDEPAKIIQKEYYGRYAKEYEKNNKALLPCFVYNGTTTEAMIKTLAENPKGCIGIYDELQSCFKELGQYKGGGGSDLPVLVEFFDGRYRFQNRSDRGKISFLENPFLALHGGIQPAELIREAKDKIEIGLMGRFSFVMPYPKTRKGINFKQKPISSGLLKKYERLVKKLRSLDAIVKTIVISEKGKDIFQDFDAELGQHISKHKLKDGWYNKLNSKCFKIACILGVVDDVDVDEISPEVARRAVGITKYLWRHGEAVNRMIGYHGAYPMEGLDSSSKIISHLKKYSNKSDVRKLISSKVCMNADEARKLVGEMVCMGILDWNDEKWNDFRML